MTDLKVRGNPEEVSAVVIVCICLAVIPVILVVIILILLAATPILIIQGFIYLLKRGLKWHR